MWLLQGHGVMRIMSGLGLWGPLKDTAIQTATMSYIITHQPLSHQAFFRLSSMVNRLELHAAFVRPCPRQQGTSLMGTGSEKYGNLERAVGLRNSAPG